MIRVEDMGGGGEQEGEGRTREGAGGYDGSIGVK